MSDFINFSSVLPTEIIFHIFSLLTIKDLTRCRAVCINWKLAVDSILSKDEIWRTFCEKDFKYIYITAKRKANSSLSWCDLYKSLTMWPQILSAKEELNEFAVASSTEYELNNFSIIENNEIGVQSVRGIVYYNLDNLEYSTRRRISGCYVSYAENPKYLAIFAYNRSLYIIRKLPYSPRYDNFAMFHNVKYYLQTDNEIYFQTNEDQIYCCNVIEDKLKTTLLPPFQEAIMCMTYFNEKLFILTLEKKIYSYSNEHYTLERSLGPDLLKVLTHYNFLDQLQWNVFYGWWHSFTGGLQYNIFRDVSVVKQYGDIVLIGTTYGVLSLYCLLKNSVQNLNERAPIKQWYFFNDDNCFALHSCPILKIDVVEQKGGHKIIIAIPKKIIVLNYSHI